ncbi:MAG: 50S ribosomal protein L17 [Proteobacteria bacterium]|nr:50S ribosomal protein L17 [Pseudomonadota bacterium]
MRHRIAGYQLNVKTDHRRAMLRNLAAGLFEHGQITTTLPKAKAVQPFVEQLITMAKRPSLASRREVTSRLTDRKVFAWVADPNTKEEVKSAQSRLWELPSADEIEFNRYGELRKAPRLIHRAGGYTRIVKLDKRRLGDATDLVVLQLVGAEEGPQVKGRKSTRRANADKRTAFAKKAKEKAAATKG